MSVFVGKTPTLGLCIFKVSLDFSGTEAKEVGLDECSIGDHEPANVALDALHSSRVQPNESVVR